MWGSRRRQAGYSRGGSTYGSRSLLQASRGDVGDERVLVVLKVEDTSVYEGEEGSGSVPAAAAFRSLGPPTVESGEPDFFSEFCKFRRSWGSPSEEGNVEAPQGRKTGSRCQALRAAMTFSNDDPKPAKNRRLMQVGVVLGVIVLYFAGSWAKERSIDSDRIFVGVHALNGKEAIVMLRDDKGEEHPSWRIERIRLGSDEPLWGYSIRSPYRHRVGNGMSVAGGQSVILDEVGAVQVSVTALDLDTGETTWRRPLGKSDGHTPMIVGGDRFVLVDGGDRVQVLDRATGKTLYKREGQGQTQSLNYAFTETWIEFRGSWEVEYLELETGRVRRLEDAPGARCRVGGHVYGLDLKGTLRSRDLATGESAEVVPPEALPREFQAWSCGWQNNPDGSLRLLFADERPGLFVVVDLDPASPAGSGRVAWTHTFAADIETGDHYRIPNRLDLVWSGEVPRFAPLEIHMPSPNEDDSQIVVVDTHDGTLSRQGPPGARIARGFSSFKRGKTVFMVLKGRRDETPGTVLAMDTLTGETHAVSSPGRFRIVPPSVTDAVVWAWTDALFSPEGDLAITVLDQQLQVLQTSNPKRAPTADEDAVTSLLGPDPE